MASLPPVSQLESEIETMRKKWDIETDKIKKEEIQILIHEHWQMWYRKREYNKRKKKQELKNIAKEEKKRQKQEEKQANKRRREEEK